MRKSIMTVSVLLFVFILGLAMAHAATKTITATIVVAAGKTYDGGGVTIKASGLGDGSQDEDQKPIFKLMSGATLKNVIIAAPGADGVHCYGNNTVSGVTWQDVGEDALTIKGEGTFKITSCKFYKAADKVLQVNKKSTMTVTSCYADTMGKFIRQNGGTTFTCTWYLNGCTIKNASDCIARTDSSTTKLYYRNLTYSNVKTLWKFPSVSSQVKTY